MRRSKRDILSLSLTHGSKNSERVGWLSRNRIVYRVDKTELELWTSIELNWNRNGNDSGQRRFYFTVTEVDHIVASHARAVNFNGIWCSKSDIASCRNRSLWRSIELRDSGAQALG